MTDELKKLIDDMDYIDMLNQWRYAKVGDIMFQGETGEYFAKVMREKRERNNEEHVRCSKKLGWNC